MPDWREEAEKWMDENPAIYDLFRKFAQQAMQRGCRFGIALLTERIRWEVAVEWGGAYKINNNYRAYIARRLVRDLVGLGRYMSFRNTEPPTRKVEAYS